MGVIRGGQCPPILSLGPPWYLSIPFQCFVLSKLVFLTLLEESSYVLHIFKKERFTSITYEFVEVVYDLAQSLAAENQAPL